MSVALANAPLKNATQPGGSPAAGPAPLQWADRIAVGLLAATAIVAPLMVGSTGEWPRLGVEAAMAAAVVAWVMTAARPWPVAVIPVFVAAMFCMQLAPLSDGLLARIAPVSVAAWKVSTQGQPGVAGSISIAPAETLAGCCRLLLGLATIAAVADLARQPVARRWLLRAVAVSAVLTVTLGVVFPVGYSEKVLLGLVDLKGPFDFWRSPIPPPAQTSGWAYLDWTRVGDERYPVELRLVGDGFGSFVSSNEFAAAVHLALPAALAVLMVLTRRRLPDPGRYAVLVLLAAGAAWVVGGMAGSRAGVASLVFGTTVFVALTVEAVWARRACGVATASLAAGLLAFVVAFHGCLGGVVRACPVSWQKRLIEMGADGRVLASEVALRTFRASPAFGTGLGSYGDQYARMAGSGQVWYFAHNDYAQFLAEGGCVALLVLIAGAALLAVAARRFVALPPGADRTEVAAGWAALAAIFLHSAFDWNMHVPANAFLASLAAGLALSTMMPGAGNRNRVRAGIGRWLAASGLAVACLLALVVLARKASSEAACRTLREAIVADQLAARDAGRPDPVPAMLAAVARGEVAAGRDPANASLAVCLGQVNLHLAVRATGVGGKAHRAAATRWFDRARTAAAAVRGFPEPLPPPKTRP